MKRRCFLIITLCLFFSTILAYPVAANIIFSEEKGLPYDDFEKYTYHVESLTRNTYYPDEWLALEEKVFSYKITVRDKNSLKFASIDEMHIKISSMPSEKQVSDVSIFHYKFDEMEHLAKTEINRYFTAYIQQHGNGYQRGVTWEEYKQNVMSNPPSDRDMTMQEGTFMGRTALYITGSWINERENLGSYQNSDSCSVHVYFEDIELPGGIFVLRINYNYTAHTSVSRGFKNYFSDWDLRWAEIKSEVDSVFESAKADTQALLNSYQSMKIEVAKTTDIRERGTATADITIETDADREAGETDVTVPAMIVVGLAGAAAAVAGLGGAGGAGAAGSSSGSEGNGDNNKGSSYKMYIYKDFGDAIRYDKPEVVVYARMAEITPDGTEIQRMDLTGQITIFSNDRQIKVGTPTMAGSYIGATVWAESFKGQENPNQGVISFCFNGEGGSFQNNVNFRLIGDPIIRIPQPNLYILAGSGETFYLNYELIDFVKEETAQVQVKIMNNNPTFELEVGKDHQGESAIIATDDGTEQENNHLYGSSINCEIIAENETEYARTLFSVVNCYEGLYADFMGHNGEIKGYGKDRTKIDSLADAGIEMEKTPVVYQLALWNVEKKELARYKPENLTLSIEDEKGIFNSIGIDIELQQDFRREDAKAYYLRAKKPFPSMKSAEGVLKAELVYDGEDYERESAVKLMPDILRENKAFEQEYKDTIYIINEYLPEKYRQEKLNEIEEKINKWETEDLKTYRKAVWETAQEIILKERDSYLNDALWYDNAITVCNVLVFVGDIAFNAAIIPLGGPITAFLLDNVKQAIVNMAEIYFSSDSIGWNELDKFVEDHVKYLSGQADVFYGPPEKNEPKKLAAWLAGFTLYRIAYHWMWSKDDYGRPVGIYGATVSGIGDLTKKGVGIMLKDYVKRSAKKDGVFWKKQYSRNMSETATEEAQNMLSTAKDTIDGIDKAATAILDYIDYLSGGQIVLKPK